MQFQPCPLNPAALHAREHLADQQDGQEYEAITPVTIK